MVVAGERVVRRMVVTGERVVGCVVVATGQRVGVRSGVGTVSTETSANAMIASVVTLVHDVRTGPRVSHVLRGLRFVDLARVVSARQRVVGVGAGRAGRGEVVVVVVERHDVVS